MSYIIFALWGTLLIICSQRGLISVVREKFMILPQVIHNVSLRFN